MTIAALQFCLIFCIFNDLHFLRKFRPWKRCLPYSIWIGDGLLKRGAVHAFLQGNICGRAIGMILKAGLLLFFLVHVCLASLIPPVGPPPIQGVQGNDDQVMSLHLLQAGEMSNLKLRYEKIQEKLAPGNRRYNLFWSEFESTSSAPAPLMCPSGTLLIPANEVRYPCLSNICTLPYINLAD